MIPRSRLHVPAPPARPGQEPDFSYLQLSAAGAVNRPDVTAAARDIESLSLPGDQNRLIEAVARANPRTVVVLTGGPVAMPWLHDVAGVLDIALEQDRGAARG